MSARVLEPPAARTTASCRACGGRQEVEPAATGFRCALCAAEWRWASCGGCGRFHLLEAHAESWSCRSCRAANRSWWRTATARRDEREVAAQRRSELVERRRRAARRRRRPVLIVGAAASVVAAVVALAVVAAGPATDPTRRACVAYATLRPALFNGSVGGSALRAQVQDLARAGAGADAAVASASQGLASSGPLHGPSFEQALVELDDACRRHDR